MSNDVVTLSVLRFLLPAVHSLWKTWALSSNRHREQRHTAENLQHHSYDFTSAILTEYTVQVQTKCLESAHNVHIPSLLRALLHNLH